MVTSLAPVNLGNVVIEKDDAFVMNTFDISPNPTPVALRSREGLKTPRVVGKLKNPSEFRQSLTKALRGSPSALPAYSFRSDLLAWTIQGTYRQRKKKVLHFRRLSDKQAVRFLPIGADLRQKFVGGHAGGGREV
jgi:hypothetical protein